MSLKLGAKISAGYGLLILITLIGSLLLMRVSKETVVKTDTMSSELMPTMEIANEIERTAWDTIHSVNLWLEQPTEERLATAKAKLSSVSSALDNARKLAAKDNAQQLGFLREAMDKADQQVALYGKQLDETVSIVAHIAQTHKYLDATVEDYYKACDNLHLSIMDSIREIQRKEEEGLAVAEASDYQDLFGQVMLVTNIKELGPRSIILYKSNNLDNRVFTQVQSDVQRLAPMLRTDTQKEQLGKCSKIITALETGLINNSNAANELSRISEERTAAGQMVLEEAKNTALTSLKATATNSQTIGKSSHNAYNTLLGGALGIIIFGSVITWLISSSTTKPIREIATNLTLGADHTTQAAAEVSNTSQSLAEGANNQAASLQETSASLERMAGTTRMNTESADRMNMLVREAFTSVELGTRNMASMQQSMNSIQTASTEVSKIVRTIDEIALQTNILALNAAIEAARAGEAGAGFAVVAEEVRNLAQRSAIASKETNRKIELSMHQTAEGVAICAEVSEALNTIQQKVKTVDELAVEVARSSKEQASGIEEINKAILEIDRITQSNAANAEEGASASEELNAQALTMRDSIKQLLALVDGNKEHFDLPEGSFSKQIPRLDQKSPHRSPRATKSESLFSANIL